MAQPKVVRGRAFIWGGTAFIALVIGYWWWALGLGAFAGVELAAYYYGSRPA